MAEVYQGMKNDEVTLVIEKCGSGKFKETVERNCYRAVVTFTEEYCSVDMGDGSELFKVCFACVCGCV